MFEKLKSRKFWFAFLGALFAALIPMFSEDITVLEGVVGALGVIGSYLFGQSYVDGKKAESEGKK